MAGTTTCIVCALESAIERQASDSYLIHCQRCGDYVTSGTLQAMGIPQADERERAGLMAALRYAADRREPITLLSDNWQQIAAGFAESSISQKLRRLLEYIGAESRGTAGVAVPVSDHLDFPRFFARNPAEYHWLRQTLTKQGLVQSDPNSLSLTIEGWEVYRPGRGGAPGTCFVAMSFDPELDIAFDEGIHRAVVEDCGLSVIRVDRVEHNENINDKIITDIRSCQFVVADFTHHRNGVYFEAGFAFGIGRPVIWTCRRDHLNEAHFDTRPFNHVVWDRPEDLREKLTNRIRATILI
jgi:hypothetical protein